MKNQAVTLSDKAVEYVPLGEVNPIKLSLGIIARQLVTPTRSGQTPDEKTLLDFLMLCRARQLNPFTGDAFIVGYESKDGAKFSIITAHQHLLARAEMSAQFDGMESGVILERDGEVTEREGDFTLPGENVVGGWAKVYRKDRSIPAYRRAAMHRYNTGRSLWDAERGKPESMIVKCSEADALRSAFPLVLRGLYTQEEGGQVIDITPVTEPGPNATADAHNRKAIEALSTTESDETPQEQLEAIVTGAKFDWETFRKWGEETGNLETPDGETEPAGFENLDPVFCRRMIKAKAGLIRSLKEVK